MKDYVILRIYGDGAVYLLTENYEQAERFTEEEALLKVVGYLGDDTRYQIVKIV